MKKGGEGMRSEESKINVTGRKKAICVGAELPLVLSKSTLTIEKKKDKRLRRKTTVRYSINSDRGGGCQGEENKLEFAFHQVKLIKENG